MAQTTRMALFGPVIAGFPGQPLPFPSFPESLLPFGIRADVVGVHKGGSSRATLVVVAKHDLKRVHLEL